MLKIKNEIIKIIKNVVGKDLPVLLTEPPRLEMGDWSFACFELAKKENKNPAQVAKDLSEKIRNKNGSGKIFREAQAVGPYVNFFVSHEALVKEILSRKSKVESRKGKVALDVFQANPLKLFHIGHLFNAVLGESIRRLQEAIGYKTVTYSYSGDVGVHVARWLWYFKNFYQGEVPKKEFTKWAGEIYAKASAKVGEKPEYELEVNELNRLIAARDKSIIKLWQKMTKTSYAASWQIAKELQCRVDYSFPESVCEKPGMKFVQERINPGGAGSGFAGKSRIKKDQGAWGVNLGKELGFFILLKTDGTALYQTKDLGLARLRHEKIGQYKKCLFVVGAEQEFYFKQLFKTLEILNHPDKGEKIHVVHGLVSLKDGKMASRLGNVVSYDQLRDETYKKILAEIESKNPDLPGKKATAMKVALGALKFSLLKSDRQRNIKFDWDEALSFEGNSGPYLQYTYARIQAIERKAKNQKIKKSKNQKISFNLLTNIEEVRLVKVMGRFAESVTKAAENYQPYVLAQYLLELAGEFNHFYHQCQVVDPEHLAQSQARLFLVGKTAQILEDGLKLLGIETVEEM